MERRKAQRHGMPEAIGFSPVRIAGACDLLHSLGTTTGLYAMFARPAAASPGYIDFCIDLVVLPFTPRSFVFVATRYVARDIN